MTTPSPDGPMIKTDQGWIRMPSAMDPLPPPTEWIRCCPDNPCLICGCPHPSGHVHVTSAVGRGSRYGSVLGSVCSSHTLSEAIMKEFLVTLEADD